MGKQKNYLLLVLKGCAMGAADVVPGVSGGTIAFITGIYEELIDSIKSIDLQALKLLLSLKFADFWKKINGSFLLGVAGGIAISIFSLAKLMTWLLEHHPIYIWSFFFGLIVASSVLVAKEINNIRESKNALLRGQADNMPSDGAQLKIMIDNLNLQEEAMTKMFSGIREKEEKTFTVRLTPDKEFSNEVAFRFSKKLGVVANNDLAGTPFYISLKDLKTVKIPQEDGKKKKDLEGIAYNVPGQALVTLTDGKKKLYEGELPVTQFGIIEYLAPVLFNKNSTIKVYFDPNTGGLLKVDREEGK